jgi:putative DNA primase/helicase
MHVTFDPAAAAESAMCAVESGQGPLILSPAAPLDSARQLIRRRYTQVSGRTIHYHQSVFYMWGGTHYHETSRDEVRAIVYEFLEGAFRLDRDGNATSFNPNRAKVGDVVEALAAAAQLPEVVRPPTWLEHKTDNSPSDIFACSNGLLHLPTRTLLAHTPAYFSVNAVEYPYDPNAGEPTAWLEFLDSLWHGDAESVETLQELFGLLLTPNTAHQKCFLLVGPKRCGKGTIARVARGIIGANNVAGPTLGSLAQNFGLAPLIGKPLAIISDARLGGRSDVQVVVERLLSITGEDWLSVNRKFLPAWNGQLPTRFLLLTNELPKLGDASGAIASRFIVLRLVRSFYGQEDLSLTQKLLEEAPKILLWALVGRDRLASRGYFVQPRSARQAAEELTDLASPMGAFVRTKCILDPHSCVQCDMLYDAWTRWCDEQHREHKGTIQSFGRDLRAVVPDLEVTQPRDQRTGERVRYYQGIGLLS